MAFVIAAAVIVLLTVLYLVHVSKKLDRVDGAGEKGQPPSKAERRDG